MTPLDQVHLATELGTPMTAEQIDQVDFAAMERRAYAAALSDPSIVVRAPARKRHVVYRSTKCRNCGTPYLPGRMDQVHCSSRCGKEASNRDMLRGRMILAYAYNWRKARGKGKKDDFAALCRELDRMVREDREAGRLGPKGYDPLRGE